MIKGDFRMASDIIEVIVDGNNLYFYKDGAITTIEGIKLNKQTTIKEFPDLIDKEDWRKIAIDRLKEHMNKMNNEMEKINYVKEELTKQGYTALFMQRAGFRPQRFQEKK